MAPCFRHICITLLSLGAFHTSAQDAWKDSLRNVISVQKDDTSKVWMLRELGESFIVSNPDSGFFYAQQGLALADKLKFNRGRFWSMVSINKALNVLGNYTLELDYAFKVFTLAKEIDDPDAIAWSNGMLGDCYFNLGEYDSSITHYRAILRSAQQINHPDLFSLYSALVPVFTSLKQYDSALVYAKKGFAMFSTMPLFRQSNYDSRWIKSLQYRFLGEAFAGKKGYDSSIYFYHMGLCFSKDVNNKLNVIDIYNALAKIYQQKAQLDSATWYAKKVLTETTSKSYPLSLLTAAGTLANSYETLHQPDSTLKYIRLAFAFKDSLFDRQKLAAIQNVFFKEKEKQREVQAAETALRTRYRNYLFIALALIAFTVAIIVIRNRRTRQLQAMRNSIADDLHDDIGSTLSSISIMSELARSKSPEAASLLHAIGESTSAAQENMSDIVWAVNPKNDRLENVLHRMNGFASEILEAKNMELGFNESLSAPSVKLTMQQRKNFYLFFKEAINNAAKYSKAQKICVHITEKDQWVSMNIIDNGCGFNTTSNFEGNGMHSLKKRATELNADFKINSRMNEGTEVQLKFRIS